eukprot:CAMPEP_0113582568 /NCGR_PEP_ID=MMETSP0015_2-20120614/31989_1 /TAXON_ID=2838 /ORGANISM="Odontella" /LENGTH=236 /DNA_ID=CAMNT_0000487259 /DNA_START=18 /DNA_END=725 /DNA_ORIENTATION=- /assembly_acc=CAM_ASM_000160
MMSSSVKLCASLRPAARSAQLLSKSTTPTSARCKASNALFHSSGRAAAKSGGKKPLPPKTAPKAPAKRVAEPASEEAKVVERLDPQQLASEFVRKSSNARPQGTEALASMTPEQKMRNYATAASLVGFVGFVWWYSMQSVGRSDGGFEELQAEADEARVEAEKKSLSEIEAERLAEIDVTMSNLETEDGEDVGEGVIVAIAAPDEIAREEEEMNLSAKDKGGTKGRPLWKKVVFFW